MLWQEPETVNVLRDCLITASDASARFGTET